MTSEDKHIDPNTATIILFVLFLIVLSVLLTVMCKSHLKKRNRNVDTIFPKSKIQISNISYINIY